MFVEDMMTDYLSDKQREIVERVRDNIEKKKRMQTIFLPNAGGKTTLSFVLSVLFKQEGKRVLYFTDELAGCNKETAAQILGTDAEKLKGIDFGNTANIKQYYKNQYDIVITDAIYGTFSKRTLANLSDLFKNKNLKELEKNNNLGIMSLEEKSLLGVYYLQELIERAQSLVISFWC